MLQNTMYTTKQEKNVPGSMAPYFQVLIWMHSLSFLETKTNSKVEKIQFANFKRAKAWI
jgi:hypothetical protein